MAKETKPAKPRYKIVEFFDSLGPGLVTGAADDDPSGIGTYSVAGAQLGTTMLWTAILTWPLMSVVQMMCARIGMVTGEGLACALRQKFPRSILMGICGALFLANTLNVGADLAAMADAVELLTGWSSHIFVVVFGVGIAWAAVGLSYFRLAKVLKWLALVLFAYIIAAILLNPPWKEVLHDTFVPSLPSGKDGWATLVAILGTTISPYLFFWQSAQEVEEKKAAGKNTPAKRMGANAKEIFTRKLDVYTGTFFSNSVMYFIILTTALTLHRHGITQIETTKQAAEALKPLAGNYAFLLFTVGLIGTGILAIPTLTGSAAYALAETFHWEHGLDMNMRRARPFYLVILASSVFAMVIDFSDFNPLKALYWSAIFNGLLAPFLLVGILFVAMDKKVMRRQPSSLTSLVIVAITALLMFGAAVGMFL